MESSLTQVILVVDYWVVIGFGAGVSLYWFNMVDAIACMDGSLKLTL